MTVSAICEKGHSYIALDVYLHWPPGAPKCPACFEEWRKSLPMGSPRFSFHLEGGEDADERPIIHCKECRFWYLTDKQCDHEKMGVYLDRLLEPMPLPDDGTGVEDAEQYNAWMLTGPNFGCIHGKAGTPREREPRDDSQVPEGWTRRPLRIIREGEEA